MITASDGYGTRLKQACSAADLRMVELETLAIDLIERAGLVVRSLGHDRGLVFAVAYAQVLGLSLDWLLLGKGPLPSPEDTERAVAAARGARVLRAPKTRRRAERRTAAAHHDLAGDPVWQSGVTAPDGPAETEEQRRWSEEAEREELALLTKEAP